MRRECDQFCRVLAAETGITPGPTDVDLHIASYRPPQRLQALQECPETDLSHCIVSGAGHQHADAPHPHALLRPRRERPRRRAAEQRDELALPHSITSSAIASSDGGTVRPSIRAVSALMTSSNLVACTTGKSAGFSPFRMRPA